MPRSRGPSASPPDVVMLTRDETLQALLEEPASQAKQKADGPGGGGALTDARAKPMRCWGRSCRRQGAASLLTALSSSRGDTVVTKADFPGRG